MTAAAAPFFAEAADAPDGAVLRWLICADGVRIRAALWRGGTMGTVLLFPGRTEYIEKYGPAAGEMAARGYSMVTVDWRGQGLADRPLADHASGHVARFLDYQKDVAALLDFARAEKLPEPYFLVAHSMGGAIGLRAIYRGLPVRAVTFSAPMWGIRIHPALRPAAWVLSTASRVVGHSHQYAPGTKPITYVAEAPFAGNVLTSDPQMYAFMQAQVRSYPELALGGPSLHWLSEALRECLRLRLMASPKLPCVTMLGTVERVVDRRPIHDRMARWPGGTLIMVPGAEHEVMMETPAIRAQFYDTTCARFEAHR